ncbi:hypothetical protein IEQ34_025844 [Dendrobium chrysotoxum]|uniref:DNA-directed RNA polymerase n=1 Tax=Dendrobium chrysotoxum TaxID=161865 RepID=A0AAV7FNU6_DENCH|nr:hypothetical protein IEQ34_025844 [Dendrobium chrysotoxum]
MIRVSTLVERLENSVRTQALLLRNHRCKKKFTMSTETTDDEDKKRSKLEKMYPIGLGLVSHERDLITFMNDKNGNVRVMKKKGSSFLPSHLYAVCNFDISLLPIKLNLPMVCKPLDWTSACPEGEEPRTLSDLSGGRGKGDSKKLCGVMNKLQGQAFQINTKISCFFEASDLLREFHMKDKNIQCSRYEDFIIKLAIAYDGYHFSLPAFLDFRGRIYRSGILHFHERDLARSLILFAGTESKDSISDEMKMKILGAAAFH